MGVIQHPGHRVGLRTGRQCLHVQHDRHAGRQAGQRFAQRGDRYRPVTIRIGDGALAVGGPELPAGIQLLQLLDGLVGHRATAIGIGGQIGRAIQYRHAITAQLHAQPHGVGAIAQCRANGDQGVFRRVGRAGAVSHQQRAGAGSSRRRLRRAAGAEADGEGTQGNIAIHRGVLFIQDDEAPSVTRPACRQRLQYAAGRPNWLFCNTSHPHLPATA